MLTFAQQVHRTALSGTTQDITEVSTWSLLASVDKLFVQVRTAQAAGQAPKLTVALETSNDGRAWTTKSTLLNQQALTAGTVESFYASDAGSTPSGALVRLTFQLVSSDDACSIVAWVSGRVKAAARRGEAESRARGSSKAGGCGGCGGKCGGSEARLDGATIEVIRSMTSAGPPFTAAGLDLAALGNGGGGEAASPGDVGRLGGTIHPVQGPGCQNITIPGGASAATRFCERCTALGVGCWRVLARGGGRLGYACRDRITGAIPDSTLGDRFWSDCPPRTCTYRTVCAPGSPCVDIPVWCEPPHCTFQPTDASDFARLPDRTIRVCAERRPGPVFGGPVVGAPR